MKKLFFLFILSTLFSLSASAQYLYPYRYFIQFTDKNNNGYSLNNPSAFLSSRAIQRRINQNIPYDFHDLPLTQAYVDSVSSYGDTIVNRSKWFNGVTIQTSDPNVLSQILALPFVVGAKAVGRIKNPNLKQLESFGFIQREAMLQDNSQNSARVESNQNNNGLSYGFGYNQIHMISGDYLHGKGYLGDGKVIAILDAGFLRVDTLSGFDSLWINNQILGTKDFVSDTAVSQNVFQDHYHGCMVLSCIGSNWPGTMIGTAPHASFWLLVTEDANTENIIEEYNWDVGAEFADSVGADIISTSLGYTTFDHHDQDHTYADMNGRTTPASHAAEIAAEKGILVVASAGNSGSRNDPWHFIGTPADADSILAIGAVDPSRNLAAFSSKGPSADGRIKPDVADQGQWTTVIDPDNSNGSLNNYANGTSFSAPILAGAVACLWQAHPSLTNMQIRQAVIESASQYLHPDSLLGYGIPDFAFADSILSCNCLLFTDELVSVYPNPFSKGINYSFYAGITENIQVTLTDAIGNLISSETHNITDGALSRFSIPLSFSIPDGIYILQVKSDKSLFSRKIVKI